MEYLNWYALHPWLGTALLVAAYAVIELVVDALIDILCRVVSSCIIRAKHLWPGLNAS
jgi:hypothetical protein